MLGDQHYEVADVSHAFGGLHFKPTDPVVLPVRLPRANESIWDRKIRLEPVERHADLGARIIGNTFIVEQSVCSTKDAQRLFGVSVELVGYESDEHRQLLAHLLAGNVTDQPAATVDHPFQNAQLRRSVASDGSPSG
ncbi:hypothetical protein [Rhodopirellula sp. P2]|uniref:hypothetical protein n=1 Tax=Rhodopirellula sp. P2 TaxID=2127060 RepID=UPI002368D7B8|nr:hypothetical protein [Rhodopirellula sp. P2]WDQ15444.1 hypothetical protein PSR62_17580 [Rhodopirellula sp. P2]